MKRIAVLTSGGDSPGMNLLLEQSYEKQFIIISKFWCLSGYQGLLDDNIHKLELGSVGDTIQRGGTFLYSARCPQFKDESVRQKGLRTYTSMVLKDL